MNSDLEASVLVLTRNRSADLLKCLNSIKIQQGVKFDIIIVDNGSSDNTRKIIDNFEYPRIKRIYSETNTGVCGGRNLALRAAAGKAIFIIDDDAEFTSPHAIRIACDRLNLDETIGALAFKITDNNTGMVDRRFFPSRNKKRSVDTGFETTWLIGAGHCLRKEAVNAVGLYRDFFPYGSEEFDYSIRLIDADYRILYFPEINILHRESPKARLPNRVSSSLKLKHRLKAAILNYPLPYIVSFFVFRSAIVWIRSGLDPRPLTSAYMQLWADRHYIRKERNIVSRETIKQIKALRGNVYF